MSLYSIGGNVSAASSVVLRKRLDAECLHWDNSFRLRTGRLQWRMLKQQPGRDLLFRKPWFPDDVIVTRVRW